MATNAKAPHKAVMLIRLDVYELSKIGECSHVVNPAELAENDIKTKAVYTIEGFDKFDCLSKLKKALNGFTRKDN